MSVLDTYFKAPNMPVWTTFFLYFMGALGLILGLPALFGHGLMEVHSIGWGGRQLGLGIATLIAALWRNPLGYLMAFIGGFCRELGYLLEAIGGPSFGMGMLITFLMIMSAQLIAAWLSYQATHKI